jgi:hypothetical protein
VPTHLKGRYRSRKADIVTNILGVCAPDEQFIYMLPGWEGSTHDSRVLHDAISMPNRLCVPQGEFYFNNFHLVYWYNVLSANINFKISF